MARFLPIFILCFSFVSPLDTVTVWVDDARTQRITVPQLDPDEVADPSSLSLSLGGGTANFGISIGWSREKGINYDDKAKELIERIKALVEEFNEGKLSLETYNRRMRLICNAEIEALKSRVEMLAGLTYETGKAVAEMDQQLGIPPQDLDQLKSQCDLALSEFKKIVEEIEPDKTLEPVALSPAQAREKASENLEREKRKNKRILEESFKDFDRAMHRVYKKWPKPEDKERVFITIWKDYEKTERITVPKLDVESLVKDVNESLSVGNHFAFFLISFDVGPRTKFMLEKSVEYSKACQMLILKYKQLCLEYNGGLVCQEGYVDRLKEIYEAENKAREMRQQMGKLLNQRAQEMIADMDKRLNAMGGMGKSSFEGELEDIGKEFDDAFNKLRKKKQGPSLVATMSREHREDMIAAQTGKFYRAVENIEVLDKGDTVEVWVDDAKTKKVRAPRLDPDLFAQNTKTQISLHITYFNFGPKINWAKEKGLNYEHAAQLLIIKYKQLIMDYNAQLVSQESFERRRKNINHAVEAASKVRQAFSQFLKRLKQSAFDEMDRQFEIFDDF